MNEIEVKISELQNAIKNDPRMHIKEDVEGPLNAWGQKMMKQCETISDTNTAITNIYKKS